MDNATETPSDQSLKYEHGWLERRGVEHIPESERNSSPKFVFQVFFGCSLSLLVAVYGGFAMLLGLSFEASLAAIVVGNALPLIVTLPMILFGPRTGTNNQIASSGQFGTRGRLIGSGLSLFVCIVFGSITIWASGDAVLGLISRATGVSLGTSSQVIAYTLVSASIVVVAIYGHSVIVRLSERVIVPVNLLVLAVGFVAFAPQFSEASNTAVAGYVTGSFWSTWYVTVALISALTVSYMPMLGDYSRYIPSKTPDRRLLVALGSGFFFGSVLAMSFGAFVIAAVAREGMDFVPAVIGFSPLWFLPFMVIYIIAGAASQGAMSLYSTGLDMESIFPVLTRVQSSIIAAIVTLIMIILGGVVFDATSSINTAATILVMLVVPWGAVNIVGLILTKGAYDPTDMQSFGTPNQSQSRYWYSAGWSASAVIAWIAGAVVSLLSASTAVYTGALVPLFGGLDMSLVCGLLVAGGVYWILLRLRPQDSPEMTRASGRNFNQPLVK